MTSEAYREQVGPIQPKPAPVKRGRRWSAEDVFPPKWIDDGYAIRHKHKLPRINMALEAEKFVNWALSASGRVAVKLDWHRTWLNWCMNTKGQIEETPVNGGKTEGWPASIPYIEGFTIAECTYIRLVCIGKPSATNIDVLRRALAANAITEAQARRAGF